MPSLSFFKRGPRRSLLLERNPFQILVASLRHPAEGPTVIETAAEFAADDDIGLRSWLEDKFGPQRNWLPVTCGFVPPDAVLQRESIHPKRLAEPGYLAELLLERKGSRPAHPAARITTALDPLEGTPLSAEGNTRAGLLLSLTHGEIQRFQQGMLDHRLLPQRLEFSLLPLFGAIAGHAERRQERRASVVIVIEQEHTTAYIIGKEGVQTPAPVRHGFASIVQAVRKEFNLTDAGEVSRMLNNADDMLQLRATKFVRDIGRDLKPLVDSYEMATGQPVGEIYCAYLPPTLQWLAEPLAQVMQRPGLVMDCPAWLPTVGLQVAEDLPPLGPQWLGALNLAARPAAGGPPDSDTPGSAWHFDCRLSAQLPNTRLVGRRFTSAALVTMLAAFVLTFALWQWYVIRSFNADTDFWNEKMASNQKLVDELTRATRDLATKRTRFDHAYDLVKMPFQVTDFILNLGRTLPPDMRIDRIEANATRVALSGSLQQSPEQSSLTLGRYMEEMRRTPSIGPLFSNIDLTALQRENESDESLLFEITFTLKEAQP